MHSQQFVCQDRADIDGGAADLSNTGFFSFHNPYNTLHQATSVVYNEVTYILWSLTL